MTALDLVVDTNILLSALLKPSTTQKLLFSDKIRLFAPEFSLREIEKYSIEFAKRMGKTRLEFKLAVSLITSNVQFVPEQEYKKFEEQSKKLLSDKKDWPFMALALSKKIPIWSNDKGFKQQTKAQVFTTSQLLDKL